MKNLMKKNRLMISALAVMIAIAAYLQFSGMDTSKSIGKEREKVSATAGTGVVNDGYEAGLDLDLSEEDLMWANDITGLDSESEMLYVSDYLDEGMQLVGTEADGKPEEGEIPGEVIFTSSDSTILADAKLMKEQIRAKNKATLLEIINSDGLTDIQKQTAVDCMVQMTETNEKEAAAEILLEAKGFTDVVVSINADTVDVVVNAVVLDDAKRAQIEDIVKRKTGAEPQNIIISTVAQ